jgi:hypothetical protein
MRPDLPPKLFEQLLAAASEKVRTKLVAEREHAKSDIDRVVADVAGRIQAGAATQPLSYATAQVLVESMHQAGLLTTAKLQELLRPDASRRWLRRSLMSNVPTAVIEQNMRDTRANPVGIGQGDGTFVGNHAQHHDAGGEAVSAFGDHG